MPETSAIGGACRLFVMLIATALAISGCANTSKPYAIEEMDEGEKQSPAHISFSYPQIFSRENLINDRNAETQYLNKLLDASVNVPFEPQLRRNLVAISALSSSLGITFQPPAKDQNKELSDLQREIELTKLRAELYRVQQQTQQLQAGTGTGPAAAPGVQPTQSADTAAITKKLDDLINETNKTLGAAASAVSAANQSSEPTAQSPEDKFRDLQAYRATLRSAINAAKLDDGYERDGNALLRMQFTATKFPGTGDARKQWGITQFHIEAPELSEADIARLYLNWLAHATKRVNERKDIQRGIDPRLDSLVNENKLIGLIHSEYDDKNEIAVSMQPESYEMSLWLLHSEVAVTLNDLNDQIYLLLAPYPQFPTPASAPHATETPQQEQSPQRNTPGKTPPGTPPEEGGNSTVKPALDPQFKHNLDIAIQQDRYQRTCEFFAKMDLKDTVLKDKKELLKAVFEKAPELAQSQIFIQNALPGINSEVQDRVPENDANKMKKPGNIAEQTANFLWSAMRLYELVGTEECIRKRDAIKRAMSTPPPVPDDFRLALLCREEDTECINKITKDTKDKTANKNNVATGHAAVYFITPTEQAQRLSSSASAVNTWQLALALSAGLPSSGVGSGAGLSLMNSAMGNADAMERLPLVVGYSNDDTQPPAGSTEHHGAYARDSAHARKMFGWVFGPSAFIDAREEMVGLRHTLSSYQVSVDMSIPVWWPRLTLDIDKTWVATWTPDADPRDLCYEQRRCAHQRMEITRPVNQGDFDLLTTYLLHRFPPYTARPLRIDRVEPNVISGCDKRITLLIYGVNLWRNAEVYYRGLKGTGIRVLPDMAGIAADFDLSSMPRSSNRNGKDLVVWTQEGVVSPPKGGAPRYISGDKCEEATTSLATPGTTYFINKGTLKLNADESIVQGLYNDLKLGIMPDDPSYKGSWTYSGDKPQYNESEHVFEAQLSVADANNSKLWNGKPVRTALLIQRGPNAVFQTVAEADKPLIYYDSEASASAEVRGTLDKLPGNVTITMPQNWQKAYPDLLGAQLNVALKGHSEMTLQAIPASPLQVNGTEYKISVGFTGDKAKMSKAFDALRKGELELQFEFRADIKRGAPVLPKVTGIVKIPKKG